MNALTGARRNDGFMNIMSGLGSPGLDRTVSTMFNGGTGWRRGLSRYWSTRFSLYDYSELYLGSGIAQKIIDRPSDDSFQRGVEIENDEDGAIYDEYDRLAVYTRMADAVRWSRLYGGSAILLITDDGGAFDEPLNYDAIGQVIELRVFDLPSIKATDLFYQDTTDLLKYGQVEYYELSPPGINTFRVHETRLLLMGGEPIPQRFMNRQGLQWAGRSVFEGIVDDLGRYEQGYQWSLRLLERKQQGIYKMEGLGQLFAQQADDLVSKRINLVDLVRGNLNSVVVDSADDYNIENLGLDGVQALLQEFQTALSASCGIPVVILFGKSTTGLNATGAGDLESYYGVVSHIQQVIAKPVLEKLTAILYIQHSFAGKIPEKWKLCFNSMWIPSAQEQATTDYNQEQANNLRMTVFTNLMNEQIVSPEEVRKVVVETYDKYEFPDEIPDDVRSSVDYAAGVDPTDLQVTDPNQPDNTGLPNG